MSTKAAAAIDDDEAPTASAGHTSDKSDSDPSSQKSLHTTESARGEVGLVDSAVHTPKRTSLNVAAGFQPFATANTSSPFRSVQRISVTAPTTLQEFYPSTSSNSSDQRYHPQQLQEDGGGQRHGTSKSPEAVSTQRTLPSEGAETPRVSPQTAAPVSTSTLTEPTSHTPPDARKTAKRDAAKKSALAAAAPAAATAAIGDAKGDTDSSDPAQGLPNNERNQRGRFHVSTDLYAPPHLERSASKAESSAYSDDFEVGEDDSDISARLDSPAFLPTQPRSQTAEALQPSQRNTSAEPTSATPYRIPPTSTPLPSVAEPSVNYSRGVPNAATNSMPVQPNRTNGRAGATTPRVQYVELSDEQQERRREGALEKQLHACLYDKERQVLAVCLRRWYTAMFLRATADSTGKHGREVASRSAPTPTLAVTHKDKEPANEDDKGDKKKESSVPQVSVGVLPLAEPAEKRRKASASRENTSASARSPTPLFTSQIKTYAHVHRTPDGRVTPVRARRAGDADGDSGASSESEGQELEVMRTDVRWVMKPSARAAPSSSNSSFSSLFSDPDYEALRRTKEQLTEAYRKKMAAKGKANVAGAGRPHAHKDASTQSEQRAEGTGQPKSDDNSTLVDTNTSSTVPAETAPPVDSDRDHATPPSAALRHTLRPAAPLSNTVSIDREEELRDAAVEGVCAVEEDEDDGSTGEAAVQPTQISNCSNGDCADVARPESPLKEPRGTPPFSASSPSPSSLQPNFSQAHSSQSFSKEPKSPVQSLSAWESALEAPAAGANNLVVASAAAAAEPVVPSGFRMEMHEAPRSHSSGEPSGEDGLADESAEEGATEPLEPQREQQHLADAKTPFPPSETSEEGAEEEAARTPIKEKGKNALAAAAPAAGTAAEAALPNQILRDTTLPTMRDGDDDDDDDDNASASSHTTEMNRDVVQEEAKNAAPGSSTSHPTLSRVNETPFSSAASSTSTSTSFSSSRPLTVASASDVEELASHLSQEARFRVQQILSACPPSSHPYSSAAAAVPTEPTVSLSAPNATTSSLPGAPHTSQCRSPLQERRSPSSRSCTSRSLLSYSQGAPSHHSFPSSVPACAGNRDVPCQGEQLRSPSSAAPSSHSLPPQLQHPARAESRVATPLMTTEETMLPAPSIAELLSAVLGSEETGTRESGSAAALGSAESSSTVPSAEHDADREARHASRRHRPRPTYKKSRLPKTQLALQVLRARSTAAAAGRPAAPSSQPGGDYNAAVAAAPSVTFPVSMYGVLGYRRDAESGADPDELAPLHHPYDISDATLHRSGPQHELWTGVGMLYSRLLRGRQGLKDSASAPRGRAGGEADDYLSGLPQQERYDTPNVSEPAQQTANPTEVDHLQPHRQGDRENDEDAAQQQRQWASAEETSSASDGAVGATPAQQRSDSDRVGFSEGSSILPPLTTHIKDRTGSAARTPSASSPASSVARTGALLSNVPAAGRTSSPSAFQAGSAASSGHSTNRNNATAWQDEREHADSLHGAADTLGNTTPSNDANSIDGKDGYAAAAARTGVSVDFHGSGKHKEDDVPMEGSEAERGAQSSNDNGRPSNDVVAAGETTIAVQTGTADGVAHPDFTLTNQDDAVERDGRAGATDLSGGADDPGLPSVHVPLLSPQSDGPSSSNPPRPAKSTQRRNSSGVEELATTPVAETPSSGVLARFPVSSNSLTPGDHLHEAAAAPIHVPPLSRPQELPDQASEVSGTHPTTGAPTPASSALPREGASVASLPDSPTWGSAAAASWQRHPVPAAITTPTPPPMTSSADEFLSSEPHHRRRPSRTPRLSDAEADSAVPSSPQLEEQYLSIQSVRRSDPGPVVAEGEADRSPAESGDAREPTQAPQQSPRALLNPEAQSTARQTRSPRKDHHVISTANRLAFGVMPTTQPYCYQDLLNNAAGIGKGLFADDVSASSLTSYDAHRGATPDLVNSARRVSHRSDSLNFSSPSESDSTGGAAAARQKARQRKEASLLPRGSASGRLRGDAIAASSAGDRLEHRRDGDRHRHRSSHHGRHGSRHAQRHPHPHEERSPSSHPKLDASAAERRKKGPRHGEGSEHVRRERRRSTPVAMPGGTKEEVRADGKDLRTGGRLHRSASSRHRRSSRDSSEFTFGSERLPQEPPPPPPPPQQGHHHHQYGKRSPTQLDPEKSRAAEESESGIHGKALRPSKDNAREGRTLGGHCVDPRDPRYVRQESPLSPTVARLYPQPSYAPTHPYEWQPATRHPLLSAPRKDRARVAPGNRSSAVPSKGGLVGLVGKPQKGLASEGDGDVPSDRAARAPGGAQHHHSHRGRPPHLSSRHLSSALTHSSASSSFDSRGSSGSGNALSLSPHGGGRGRTRKVSAQHGSDRLLQDHRKVQPSDDDKGPSEAVANPLAHGSLTLTTQQESLSHRRGELERNRREEPHMQRHHHRSPRLESPAHASSEAGEPLRQGSGCADAVGDVPTAAQPGDLFYQDDDGVYHRIRDDNELRSILAAAAAAAGSPCGPPSHRPARPLYVVHYPVRSPSPGARRSRSPPTQVLPRRAWTITDPKSSLGCSRLNPYCETCRMKYNLIFVDANMRPLRWPSPQSAELEQMGGCRVHSGYIFGEGDSAFTQPASLAEQRERALYTREWPALPHTRHGQLLVKEEDLDRPLRQLTPPPRGRFIPVTYETHTAAARRDLPSSFVTYSNGGAAAAAEAVASAAPSSPQRRDPLRSAPRERAPSAARGPLHQREEDLRRLYTASSTPPAPPQRRSPQGKPRLPLPSSRDGTGEVEGRGRAPPADFSTQRRRSGGGGEGVTSDVAVDSAAAAAQVASLRKEERRIKKALKQLLWRDLPQQRGTPEWDHYLRSLSQELQRQQLL
ncbi:hypothetical protein ABB37_04610 [Leptomonas pyrrhocoris]|uniref:Uncharacterized protein n=1 Tax=Leptomonas pyrrhocoris TaxID=157538 RepID=A0A0N0DVG8_LEPPY|nr:hypothetical protein ABB37_04610 [Leptomonas pyrrhocoris]KPA80341.1 hypothetical protein ABB37_04610 [Leptomonas pyrrhocoris]|eukprot:XP_015658780.1 hypothetical protein ABB37_04610 [Leptomonas pyrrhocoris]